MGLQKAHTDTSTDVSMPQAYHRIIGKEFRYTHDNSNVRLEVGVFKNKAASDAEKNPQVTMNYLITGEDYQRFFGSEELKGSEIEPRDKGYDFLKTIDSESEHYQGVDYSNATEL